MMPSSEPLFAQRFRAIVRAKRIVQKELAAHLGVELSTVSRWARGKSIPRKGDWPRIFEALGVTEEQFWDTNWLPSQPQGPNLDFSFRGEVEGPYPLSGQILRIPVVAEVRAGVPRETLEEATEHVYIDADLLPDRSPKDYIAVRVQGDSMSGVGISEGDLVIVRLQPIVESGQIAAVHIEGEGACIKRVHLSGDQVILASANDKYPPRILRRDQVRIVGRARRIVKDL